MSGYIPQTRPATAYCFSSTSTILSVRSKVGTEPHGRAGVDITAVMPGSEPEVERRSPHRLTFKTSNDVILILTLFVSPCF